MLLITEQSFFITHLDSNQLALYLPDEVESRLYEIFGERIADSGPFGQKAIKNICSLASSSELNYDDERRVLRDLLQYYGYRDLHLGLHPTADWLALMKQANFVMKDDYFLIQMRDLSCSSRFILQADDITQHHYDFRLLRVLAPLILAVSASSPIWRGQDTGFASYRSILLRQRLESGTFPIESPPLSMALSEELSNDLDFWDVRLRQQFNRIEVIIGDAFGDEESFVVMANTIAALLRAEQRVKTWVLAQFHEDTRIVERNRWIAARHGLNAELFLKDGRQKTEDFLARLVSELNAGQQEKVEKMNTVIAQQKRALTNMKAAA